MSGEVVRTKGGPKMTVLDSIARKKSEPGKKTTLRRKSPKAAAASLAPNSYEPGDSALRAVKSSQEADISSPNKEPWQSPPAVPAGRSISPFAPQPKSTPAARTAPVSHKSSPKVTSANSKILNEVRTSLSEIELAPEPAITKLNSSPTSKPPTPTTIKPQLSSKPAMNNFGGASKPPAPPISELKEAVKTTSAPRLVSSQPISANPIPPTTPRPPAPQKKTIPITTLNSTIVSQISSRAGARSGSKSYGELPANYKSAARKVTGAFVAMPILIVTSYVLYQRFVLGEERKHLDRSGTAAVDDNALSNNERRNGTPKAA